MAISSAFVVGNSLRLRRFHTHSDTTPAAPEPTPVPTSPLKTLPGR
jgi:hypothetical protein